MKRKFRSTFSDYLPQDMQASILEIGCANGMAMLVLKEMGYSNLLGIELDEELATIARGFELNVIHQDALEFVCETDEKFDFIYMFDVLEHLKPESIPNFLRKVFDLLNLNGRLMLVVPNATSPAGAYFRYIDWTHQVSFTPTSISHLLEEAGFNYIVIEDESLIPEPKSEDFHNNEQAYLIAKERYNRYKFYESFARWELKCMFGEDKYSHLVAPNMKIVATKSNDKNIQIDLRADNEIFEFDRLINNLTSSLQNQKLQEIEIFSKLNRFEEQSRGLNRSINEISEKIKDYAFDSEMLFNELYDRYSLQSIYLDKKFQTVEKTIKKMEESLIELNRDLNTRIRSTTKEIEKLKKVQFHLFKHLNRKNILNRIVQKLRMSKLMKLVRDSQYFDEEFYLRKNPDVKDSNMNPIEHYLLYGAYEGRDPSPNFSTVEYVMEHPEITESNLNPLVHKILNQKK